VGQDPEGSEPKEELKKCSGWNFHASLPRHFT